jgi:hypothetical protein
MTGRTNASVDFLRAGDAIFTGHHGRSGALQ